MKHILVVGEDPLTCALGEQLVTEILPEWGMPRPAIDNKGVTKLVSALPRFIEQARHVNPVLCIADTDGKCVKKLLTEWLPTAIPESFLLRLAVNEGESWVLADRQALAAFFEIAEKQISRTPDEEDNPKRHVLNLARKSKKRIIRQELVSETDPTKQGNGYNVHLRNFVKNHWSAQRAAENSPSLQRAIDRLSCLQMLPN